MNESAQLTAEELEHFRRADAEDLIDRLPEAKRASARIAEDERRVQWDHAPKVAEGNSHSNAANSSPATLRLSVSRTLRRLNERLLGVSDSRARS
jgi:hypothetical protein